eukprot:6034869-Karenia_brevis.AAC.1
MDIRWDGHTAPVPNTNQDGRTEQGVRHGTVPCNPINETGEGVQLGTVPSEGERLSVDHPKMYRTLGVQLGTVPNPNPVGVRLDQSCVEAWVYNVVQYPLTMQRVYNLVQYPGIMSYI